jgi:hypothetical protein
MPTDTIDLQDHNSPSAQDHSRKPQQSERGIGPAANSHQASELRHVQEERHNEEEHLSHAWHQSNGLSDEPPSDDERDFTDGMHADHPDHNGRQNGDDSEMADAESGDDMDDDMMDKISSSPSISDGGLFSSTLWPRRISSRLAPTPPLIQTPPPPCSLAADGNKSGTQSPNDSLAVDDVESDASSPFVNTPSHLPFPFSSSSLVGAHAMRNGRPNTQTRPNTPVDMDSGREDVLCGRGFTPRHLPIPSPNTRPNTPLELDTDSSSPFTSPPAHYPLHFPSSTCEVQSEVHHRLVEYHASTDCSLAHHKDEGFEDSDDFEDERRDTLGPLFSDAKATYGDRRLVQKQQNNEDQTYQQPRLVKSASDIELENQLLPLDDPLLEGDDFYDSQATENLDDTIYDNDDGAWETESDCGSNDSWESGDFLMRNDDDTEDLSFPADSRFIDSGWGGECLREIEDIDFEFVYALHTFVATVEGQANAQKGDTMVLLDDSNSYWWLVRVVKDSTIGEHDFQTENRTTLTPARLLAC